MLLLLRGSLLTVGAILSIHGRREFDVESEIEPRLDLHFDDVDALESGDPVATYRARRRQRWAEQNGLIEIPPTAEDAAAVLRFAETAREVQGAVLFHCGGGMSRAPAAALICLSCWHGLGSEQACLDQLIRQRRGATPHLGLIRFADALMARQGRLVQAVESLQR